MARMGHSNPRTYGSKLLSPKSEEHNAKFPVTTRMCDLDHLQRTGEVKYLDEEGENMPTIDQKLNTKKLRKEITTIEQFEAIGGYKDVAIKYQVAIMTAHGLMRSLRSKKAKEEKQVDNLTANQDMVGPSNAELKGTFYGIVVDKQEVVIDGIESNVEGNCENEGTEKTEFTTTRDLADNHYCADCGILLSSVTSGLCQSCNKSLAMEAQEEKPSVEDQLSGEEFDKIMDKVEVQWANELPTPMQSIDHMWKVVESDLEIIRKMYLEQAERDYNTRRLMVTGVSV